MAEIELSVLTRECLSRRIADQMCKFLKFHLLFTLCFLVILIGCANTETSREFSHTMEDGGRVKIKIEYKPKSQISGDEKFGSYYYIVQYLAPKHVRSASGEQQGKAKTSRPYIKIAFYDQKGYLLFSKKGTFGDRISTDF